nr:DNA adenine methylase [Jejubacter calystegiae]
MKSPLKWVGSKSRLMPQLLPNLPAGKRLVEPFAGSCAVMMNTDYDEYLIADVNPDLIAFYRAVAADPIDLIDRARHLFETFNSADGYYDSRFSFNHDSDLEWRAALFLYLNRHCYGGVCRYNKRGHFNTPYGQYQKPYFPEAEIRAFAEKAKRATFVCASYEETLGMVRAGDVVYCDPPYIPVTPTASFTQYHTDGFTQDDQWRLAHELKKVAAAGIPVIASNSNTTQALSLYSSFQVRELSSQRSIGAARGGISTVNEILAILSNPLPEPKKTVEKGVFA